MTYRADLHNHSCLSPCAGLDMSPSAMVLRAQELGIGILGLTDHNSARNLPAFEQCCRESGIHPMLGMEVTTREEIHVICFFLNLEEALAFGTYIESLLPDIPNIPELLGDQVYVDAQEQIQGFVSKTLSSAASCSLEELLEEVHRRGGMYIPAHIDRSAFSATSQLGFLPDLAYDAVEVMHIPCRHQTWGRTLITNSDAHYLGCMGSRSWKINLSELSFTSIQEALMNGLVDV